MEQKRGRDYLCIFCVKPLFRMLKMQNAPFALLAVEEILQFKIP